MLATTSVRHKVLVRVRAMLLVGMPLLPIGDATLTFGLGSSVGEGP
jgi:hypothetical protein